MSQILPSNHSLLSAFGTENNPIDILDENDQKNLYDNLLQVSRNQEIIKKALLCKTSLDIVFAIIMTKFPGQFLHKEQCLKKEIVQHFYDKIKINILYQSFNPRIQPQYTNESTKPFGIALIVHGVDFMDTRQIGKMFSSPIEGSKGIIQKIIWIDDSNVEIVFMNPQIAQTVMEKLTSDVKKDNVKMQEEWSTQLPRGWFQLNSYNIFGITRKLFARYITTLQVDIKKASSISRYTIFENAQKGLELYLLTKFQAFEDFQKIMKQIEYEKYGKSVLSQTRYFHHMKPPMGDQRKLDQYMAEGKKHLNLRLNFQGQRQMNQSSVPKGQEANEVVQVDNHLDLSLVQMNEVNAKPRQINLNDISIIENKENVMVNEDEDVPINNILEEFGKDKGEAMINEEADKEQAMVIEKPDLVPAEKSENSKANQKVQASFSNDMLMNLLKQMNQLSSVQGQDKLAINPENLKLILNQLTAQQDPTKSVVVQKEQKQKEIIQNTSKEQTKNNIQTIVPLQNDHQVNKKQSELQNYDPIILNFTKKNQTNSVENKGSNLNSSNRGYKQSNQGYQKSASGDFKGQASGNNYQKNQSKSSMPIDNFQEPISY